MLCRVRTIRRATVVALACVTVVSSLLASHATAVSARTDGVRASDLPSVGQAARIYDYLARGNREVHRSRTISVRTRDCLYFVSAPSAASGRWATYEMSNGEGPYWVGLDDPGIFVYQFHRSAGAKRGLAIQRRAIRRCEGTSRDGDGYRVTSREVAIPRLGARRVAHREVRKNSTGPDRRDYFVDLWVHKGRYLINAGAQTDRRAPALRPVVRLAGVTLRNLR